MVGPALVKVTTALSVPGSEAVGSVAVMETPLDSLSKITNVLSLK
jgi:hypothetical protein